MCQKILLILTLSITFFLNSFAQQQLVLIGGGERTPDVLAKIAELSGGEKGRLLVIPWAGGDQEASFTAFKKDIEKISKIQMIKSSFRPLTEQTKAEFLQQIKEATGIFFTGGDQNRVMEVLQDKSLLKALLEKYNSGTMFSGTSAGTAIMSRVMITGKGDFTVIDGAQVETKDGIGLLTDIIVDQHFIKRQRQNRLLSLMTKYPNMLGVGIDEDTALFVKDNKIGEVLGDSQIMIFDNRKTNEPMQVFLLRKGEKFDLQKRKKINK